jgi:integrase
VLGARCFGDFLPPTNSEHVRATLREHPPHRRRRPGAKGARPRRAGPRYRPFRSRGDRTPLLLGFAGAFRRSELVALDVADLEETEDGFKITIRRSKTDQEGHGETIAIARGVTTCPVKAVKAWLQAAGISDGPLFRPVAKGGRLSAERLTDQSVCKAYAERIGLKATDFGAHSCAPDSDQRGTQDAGCVPA